MISYQSLLLSTIVLNDSKVAIMHKDIIIILVITSYL